MMASDRRVFALLAVLVFNFKLRDTGIQKRPLYNKIKLHHTKGNKSTHP